MSNAFLAAMLTFSNEQLAGYHAIHSRSGIREVRQAVSLSADIRRNRKVVEAPAGIIPVIEGQKVSVKSVSELPEMQLDTLHEGPHPRSNLPWSIKNTRKQAKAQAKAQVVQVSDSVPQDFANEDSDDDVTEVTPWIASIMRPTPLSPAQRVANGETIKVKLPAPATSTWTRRPLFEGALSRISKSNCKLIMTHEGLPMTHRQEKRVLEYWASLVPAVSQAKHSHKPFGNKDGSPVFGSIRFPVRLLPQLLLRLEIG